MGLKTTYQAQLKDLKSLWDLPGTVLAGAPKLNAFAGKIKPFFPLKP